MNRLRAGLRTLRQYPSAIAGFTIILGMVVLATFALITIPYAEAIRLWRGGDNVWLETPRTAQPVWVNWWPGTNLPPTILLDSAADPATKSREMLGDGVQEITISFAFDYTYDAFPKELSVFFTAAFDERSPSARVAWRTPDGREFQLGTATLRPTETLRVSQDTRLTRRLGGQTPEVGLFADPADPSRPLKGRYEVTVEALAFDEAADIEARVVLYGQVHGWAGTDHQRRDMTIALLYGAPIALAFGLLAAVGTTVLTMLIAATGVWFGGIVDATIQRLTEVNLILPLLPILIMVGTFYSRSIWVILAVVILLTIFGFNIKTYRAIFLQVKQSPFIEAARAYGASDLRIVMRYMVPRVIPVLIPGFVASVPSFVFLEASLAVLGLGDPVLPTWGKLINDANQNGALFRGQFYWVLQPAALLLLTGFGFALVGFALDKVFNPRLRDV